VRLRPSSIERYRASEGRSSERELDADSGPERGSVGSARPGRHDVQKWSTTCAGSEKRCTTTNRKGSDRMRVIACGTRMVSSLGPGHVLPTAGARVA
jgi:hypothetical protein